MLIPALSCISLNAVFIISLNWERDRRTFVFRTGLIKRCSKRKTGKEEDLISTTVTIKKKGSKQDETLFSIYTRKQDI